MNNAESLPSVPPAKKGSQLKALFLKNGLLQAKQPCTNLCQILTPVICLIFTYLIKRLASQNLPTGAIFADNPYPYSFGDYSIFDKYSQTIDNSGKLSGNPTRKIPLQWYLINCVAADCSLMGSNDGTNAVTAPDNATLLGSIVNAPPRTFVDNFTINYYAD